MRRAALSLLILTLVVSACQGDSPVGPTAPDLQASLRGAPDLTGLLPQLERRVFIHYRRGFARPEGKGKPPTNGTSECFSFLAKGASWKEVEDYRTTFTLPVGTWEIDGINIFGSEVGGYIPEFTGDLDGINTAQKGFYPDKNVIAVTVVWGFFNGPPPQRRLVEWDLLMNTHFTFGDASPSNLVMDLEGIAAHELGHAAGLGHPPDECTDETMYAFADLGESNKRTLHAGDEAGILKLY